MSRTDLIADTLTLLRNAIMAKKKTVDVPYSKINEAIFNILKENRFIEDFKSVEYSVGKYSSYKHKIFRIYLRYVENKPVMTYLKRVSKPGLRVYVGKKEIPYVLRDYGLAILSTSQGIMTGKEARQRGIGGEVICYIW
ncbi:MAG: 30S ribosomal protein S8 [Candidatus Omnitrophica bacterium]|nr:30S ribosomal protein S8 [Candidatus Omnitrophota bacterium]